MSDSKNRELVVQCVIAVALAVGGWLILVEPRAKALSQIEQSIADIESEQAETSGVELSQLVERARALRERCDEVARFNTLAGDSSHWFAAVSDLAERQGIELLSVRPGELKTIRGEGSAEAAQIDIEAQGGYEPLARFLDDILTLDGFIRPVSAHLTPVAISAEPAVHARVTIEAFRFEVPEELRAVGEFAHVDS